MAVISYSEKDPQQFDLYDAEDILKDHRLVRHYKHRDDAMKFISRVLASPEWKALGGPRDVSVKWTRHDSGIAKCNRKKRQINLPGWAFNQQVILHELTHLITNDGHGRRFAGASILLYRRFIGHSFAKDMEDSYANHGVDYAKMRFVHKKGNA